MKATRPTESLERVFLVGVGLKRASHIPGIDAGEAERASLDELAELARSAGAFVAGSIFQMRDKIDPATVIGRGKIEEVKIEAQLHKAPLSFSTATLRRRSFATSSGAPIAAS